MKCYFAFYYPAGRRPGRGWKYPKKYVGPFVDRAAVQVAVLGEMKQYGEPRHRYTIKHLTDREFQKIWGATPGAHHPGY
jgi:hypothetical protein